MISEESDEIMNELFNPPLTNYRKILENRTKSSNFFFDYVEKLRYNLCHKMSLNPGGSV